MSWSTFRKPAPSLPRLLPSPRFEPAPLRVGKASVAVFTRDPPPSMSRAASRERDELVLLAEWQTEIFFQFVRDPASSYGNARASKTKGHR